MLHPEKNIRALFTTSKSIRCHIGATRHSNISQKTSSSISSTHGPSSIEYEPTLHRSFKKSSSSQTSTEKLPVEKTDMSCSPIRDDVFDNFFPEHGMKLLNGCSDDIIINKSYQIINNCDYRRVPTSPTHVKIKNNKVYIKESLLNGNASLHHSMKPSRPSKHHKSKRRVVNNQPILCGECLEMEKSNEKASLNPNETLTHKTPRKSPIFTVEKIPLDSNENSLIDRRRIAISEESLSECSVSDTNCKLKRITIHLN